MLPNLSKTFLFQLIGSILLSLLGLSGQAHTPDTSAINGWREKVQQFQDCFVHDSVILYAEQARSLAEQEQLTILQLEFTVRQRLALMRKYKGFADVPLALFQRVMPQAKALLVKGDSSLWIAKAYQEMVELYSFQREGALAEQSLFQALHAIPSSLQRPSSVKGGILVDMGTHYLGKGHIDSAQYYLRQSLAEIQQGSEELLNWYGLAASLSLEQDNYAEAEKYLLKQIPIAESLNNIDYRDMLTYHSLSSVALAMGDYDLALDYQGQARRSSRKELMLAYLQILKEDYPEALRILHNLEKICYRTKGFSLYYLPRTYRLLADAYIGLQEYPQALSSIQKALETESHPNAFDTTLYYIGLTELYIAEARFTEAKQQLDQLPLYDEQIREDRPYQAHVQSLLYQIHLGRQDYSLAVEAISKGLRIVAGSKDLPSDFSTLSIEQMNNPHDFFDFICARGEINLADYQHNGEKAALDSALNDFHRADRLMDILRIRFKGNEVKQALAKRAYPTYFHAIKTCRQLYQLTEDQTYQDQAFYFAEKSKSFRLHQAISESEARQFLSVPDSLLQIEQELLQRIQFLERKMAYYRENFNTPGPDGDTLFYHDQRESLSHTLFEAKKSYQALIEQFERDFPTYHRQKFQNKVLSLAEIQHICDQKQQGVMEYVVGDSSFFVFVISPDTAFFQEFFPRISLDSSINELRNSLYEYWLGDHRIEDKYVANARQYATLAFQLHQELMSPILPYLKNIDRLTIIPDGALGYLPFEILLMKHPEFPDQFSSHQFLLREFAINYAFSAAIHFRKSSQSSDLFQGNILAIRPDFQRQDHTFADISSRRRDGYGPLRFSKEEINFISDHFDATVLEDHLATKSEFMKQLGELDYSIIHLATHAKAHDEHPRKAKIAFTPIADSTEENDFLTFPEIFNLRLQTDMVVLSACETGLGEFQKGEGIMSLARAFAYAGAKSIITTLWSVDDRSTSQLMQNFYQQLSQGKNKSEAMREAKLQYLATNTDRQAHPFFWAGPVVIGSDAPIQMSNQRWIWGGVSLGLILLITVMWHRKTSQAKYYFLSNSRT